MKKLLIVESPAKIKTIAKFLGKEFTIMSTVGHIKDLPKKTLGITMGNTIDLEYVTIDKKDKVIKDFVKENLKAIGNSSLWMFLLFIPGLIRWIDYSLIGFIVFLNPIYQAGEIDPLIYARILVKNHKFKFRLAWIFIHLIIPIIIAIILPGSDLFFENPIKAISLQVFNSLIYVIWIHILWKFFRLPILSNSLQN